MGGTLPGGTDNSVQSRSSAAQALPEPPEPVTPVRQFAICRTHSLCTHELKPVPAPREIYLAWQANRTLSPLAVRHI
jgi:hypothetical protein